MKANQTATITLTRDEWELMVDQFSFYAAATPTSKLVPEQMEALRGICAGIAAKLPKSGKMMELTGPWVKWAHCCNWCLSVSLCGTAGGLSEVGAQLAAQLAAQEPYQGVPANQEAA